MFERRKSANPVKRKNYTTIMKKKFTFDKNGGIIYNSEKESYFWFSACRLKYARQKKSRKGS